MIDDKDIQKFCDALQEKQDKAFESEKHSTSPLVGFMRGKKYTRITLARRHSENGKVTVYDDFRSVHCFIDTDGNILKANGWKSPAKGIRGHIRNGAADVSIYGAADAR